jgi:hypothetical protein
MRHKLAAIGSILIATLLVTAAVAQSRRPTAKPKPKASADGGSDNPSTEADLGPTLGGSNPAPGSQAPAGASTLDASSGPVPPPPSRADIGDGGVKPSPLNPAANEMPSPPASATAVPVDYDKLIGDIAALRARVAAVGDALFVSRIAIAIQTDGDHGKIARLTVSLDDGAVYAAPLGFRAEDPTTVYEHAVAPGKHAVTVDVDRRDDRDETFKNTQRSRFIVDVPKDDRLTVTLRVGDDSSMGADFPGDKSGKYDVRVRVKASALSVKR